MRSIDEITTQVKGIVYRYDPKAEVILFGSRARGDFEPESDYDFLILSALPDNEERFRIFRNDILEEIEWKTFEVIQTIWRNKQTWNDKHAVTGFFESIEEDGILV